MATSRPTRMSPAPGVWLGIGLGGFVDGIVLHQILQWHHMVNHVREAAANPLVWDLGFLALGAVLLLAGWALARSGPVAVPGTRGIRRVA